MSEVIRIDPTVMQIPIGAREVAVADIALGGVPRGAVVLLAEPGELTRSVPELTNHFAGHGFDSAAAEVALEDSDDTVNALVGELMAHLGRRGWRSDQVGVVGYGTAARAAYLAAATFGAGAAGSVGMKDLLAAETDQLRPVALRSPWLGLFPVADRSGPGDAIRNFADDVYRLSPVHTEVVLYRGVKESFYRESRDPHEHAASFDCWQRTL